MPEFFSELYGDSLPTKEHQARCLADLQELVYEMHEVGMGHRPGIVSDISLDILNDYCLSVASRDPEMARLLLDELSARATERAPIDALEAERYIGLSDRINHALEASVPGQPDQPSTQ